MFYVLWYLTSFVHCHVCGSLMLSGVAVLCSFSLLRGVPLCHCFMPAFNLHFLLWMARRWAPATFKVHPKRLAAMRKNVMAPNANIQSNACLRVGSFDLFRLFFASSGPLNSCHNVCMKYYAHSILSFFLEREGRGRGSGKGRES